MKTLENIAIQKMTRAGALEIQTWQYKGSLSVYNKKEDELSKLLAPSNRYYEIMQAGVGIIGYVCYGAEARIAGGSYEIHESRIMDIGMGIRPDLIGQGLGRPFALLVANHAQGLFPGYEFRITIQAENAGALRLAHEIGFREAGHFEVASGPAAGQYVELVSGS